MNTSLVSFLPILIFAFFGLGLVAVSLVVSFLVRPYKPTKLKQMEYECGELPQGKAWSAFNIRFYVIALIFIIFDVESAVILPVASIFRKMNDIGRGGLVIIEILFFVGVLVAGLVYCWSKGDLDWVKSYSAKNKKSL